MEDYLGNTNKENCKDGDADDENDHDFGGSGGVYDKSTEGEEEDYGSISLWWSPNMLL